jgi:hypothetical protein
MPGSNLTAEEFLQQVLQNHPGLTPKEASRRRAQGATLKELAKSYDRSITMRRVTRAA